MCQRVVQLDIPPQDRSTFTSLMLMIASRTTPPPSLLALPSLPPPPPTPPTFPPPHFSCRALGVFCRNPPPFPAPPPAPPGPPPRTPSSELFAVREEDFDAFGARPTLQVLLRIDLSYFVILFTILMSTLHDLARGVTYCRHRYVICGLLHIGLSLGMFFAAEAISSSSCTTLDAIRNSLAILFVNDLDERVFAMLRNIAPGWISTIRERHVEDARRRLAAKSVHGRESPQATTATASDPPQAAAVPDCGGGEVAPLDICVTGYLDVEGHTKYVVESRRGAEHAVSLCRFSSFMKLHAEIEAHLPASFTSEANRNAHWFHINKSIKGGDVVKRERMAELQTYLRDVAAEVGSQPPDALLSFLALDNSNSASVEVASEEATSFQRKEDEPVELEVWEAPLEGLEEDSVHSLLKGDSFATPGWLLAAVVSVVQMAAATCLLLWVASNPAECTTPRFRRQRFDVVVAREDAPRCVQLYNDYLASSSLAAGRHWDAIEIDSREVWLGAHALHLAGLESCFQQSRPDLGPRSIVARGAWGEVKYLEMHQQELLLDMDTEFNARDHAGFTFFANLALVATAALNTVEHVFQAKRALLEGHYLLSGVHAIIFLSGVLYAVVMVLEACFFVDALLDSVSLIFIIQLDQQAFRLAKELGMEHLLIRPWREVCRFCRGEGRGTKQSRVVDDLL
ncbi:hypothetical protein AB1Y20_017988 [Prymnesium parvum]|uniref:PX domain-containing protein n=1 Tax=Prymnesium parvum TaxID=97485 RepID=A0AB34JM67_PRYPA